MKRIPVILVSLWTLSLFSCNPFADSPFSNCIVVEDEGHYTGEFLKHSQSKTAGPKKTEKCISLDKKIDNGDGPQKGKVRWCVCGMGPDCDEAGVY